jgi:nucleoside phosphorylase
MKNVLIICAMEKESKNIAKELNLKQVDNCIWRADSISLLVSGIGKQRTAISLTKYLLKNEKPDIVINVGYAGSTDIAIGKWVNIIKSYNYEWEIPGEEKYSFLDFGNKELIKLDSKQIDKVECYSSESFVTHTDLEGHIAFDMELHSVVVICDMYNIPVLSLKKISDNLSLKDYYDSTENNQNVFELQSCVKILENILLK